MYNFQFDSESLITLVKVSFLGALRFAGTQTSPVGDLSDSLTRLVGILKICHNQPVSGHLNVIQISPVGRIEICQNRAGYESYEIQ